jgi:hypothetical protein
MGRIQGRMPGRGKAKDKQSGLAEAASVLLSTLGDGKRARSRAPSKKGMVGLVAVGGIGAAAVAKRRRGAGNDGGQTQSPQPVESGVGGAGQPVQPMESQESPPAA